MTMALVHVSELLQEATESLDLTPDTSFSFVLPMGAGAVDPELIKPDGKPADIEEAIALRCSSL